MDEFEEGIRIFLIGKIPGGHQFALMRPSSDQVVSCASNLDAVPRGSPVGASPNRIVNDGPLTPQSRWRVGLVGHTPIEQAGVIDVVAKLWQELLVGETQPTPCRGQFCIDLLQEGGSLLRRWLRMIGRWHLAELNLGKDLIPDLKRGFVGRIEGESIESDVSFLKISAMAIHAMLLEKTLGDRVKCPLIVDPGLLGRTYALEKQPRRCEGQREQACGSNGINH